VSTCLDADDKAGRKGSETDANGSTNRFSYDDAGHRSVVAIEAAGFAVLPVLLDTYMNSVVTGPHDEKSKKIKQTMPRHTASVTFDASNIAR